MGVGPDLSQTPNLSRYRSDAVAACFGKVKPVISRPSCDFVETDLEVDARLYHRPDLVRFAHLDLSVTGDATGVVVGCVKGFTRIEREGGAETLPVYHIDLVLQVRPPKNGEIPYDRIRGLL